MGQAAVPRPVVPKELASAFPRLAKSKWKQTSNSDKKYNCIAWAAGDSENFWWPAVFRYWPPGVDRVVTREAFIAAFATKGYAPCENGQLEPSFEKIAVYELLGEVRHAARQLETGMWTSKLGLNIDIEHELHALDQGDYGEPAFFMKRPRV